MPGEVGEQFLYLARFPKNIGWLDNPSGKGAAVGKCGDAIEVSRIDQVTLRPPGGQYPGRSHCRLSSEGFSLGFKRFS